ncbi:alpha/beta hydrolase [Archangium violaceum]|uniref:alpha/beta fold hydrolase n=1 Tax=Archangium violaceum TaxID=83451 RepID=UPI00193C18F0|nr:alpha/beta hydrolase [Archangium violaceum]QRK05985.1 alpha/beta hydrolase [Archangium violaceum]
MNNRLGSLSSTKQKASINGQALEYIIAGQGSPTIVLINGSGGPIEGWLRVWEPLSALGTVFAYNRPGIGGSGKPVVPQTGEVIVESLRALLLHANLSPPYLLVGHSLGGLAVNLFARTFPTEVSGVVLLEATAPEDVSVMARYQNGFQRFAQRTLDSIFGKDELGETGHVSRTVDLIQRAGPFPDVPFVVVTGGRPAMAWATPAQALAARAEHQRRLAALSPQGKQMIASRSGHFPQLTEPEVVVEAVRFVVDHLPPG